jgi:macrolide-specific efflux system membrane fusion protein
MAPLDATVIARDTEPGQTVTAADTVLVLSDRLIVRAQVDETDIGRIRTGMTARVQLDAYAEVEVSAVVRHIAYEATTVNNVTIYEVEVEPGQIPEFMKSGMTATVAFSDRSFGGNVGCTRGRLAARGGGRTSFSWQRVSRGGPPLRQAVTTGMSTRGWVAVTGGLTGGEALVKPTFRMPDGIKESGSPFMPARPAGMRPRSGPP